MSVLNSRITQLSGKFASISNAQAEALECFLNESFDSELNVVDYSTNLAYSIRPTTNGFTLTTKCDEGLPNAELVNGQSYTVSFEDDDWADTSINTLDGSQSLRSYIQDLNNSNDMYDLMSALTAKFSTTPTMSLADYKNLCDQYVTDDQTVKEFERVSLLSFGSSVNRASFLNLVSSFFRQAVGISSSSLEVPDTRVYCLNSLLNLVDWSSIWSLISMAAMLISRVAGAIVALIGAIISGFSSLISKAKNYLNVTINHDEDNGTWNAPLFTLVDVDLSHSQAWYRDLDIKDDSVIEYKLHGISVYFFGPSWDHANVVCYLDNIVDPKKFGEYLRNHYCLCTAEREFGQHTGTITVPVFTDTIGNIFDQIGEVHQYSPYEWYMEREEYPNISLMASVALAFLSLILLDPGYNATKYIGIPGMAWASPTSINVWSHSIAFSAPTDDPIISLGYATFSCFLTAVAQQDTDDGHPAVLNWSDVEYKVKQYDRPDYVYDVWDDCNRANLQSSLIYSHGDSLQHFAVSFGDSPVTSSSFHNWEGNLPTLSYIYWAPSISSITNSCPLIYYYANNNDVFYNDDMNVSTSAYCISYLDSYPLTFEFETPKAKNSALTKALLQLASISTIFIASMVAYKVAKVKVTNRFREKSAKNLSKAKDDYDKGNITLKQYRKIARKYNWKASLLGLPTYDYMNSWYNVDSSSVADTVSGVSANLGTASDSSMEELDIEQPSLATMIDTNSSTLDSQTTLLQRIINLIKGPDN